MFWKKQIKHRTEQPKSINELRTARFRVFYAEPYFDIDLEREISWHTEHLKKLHTHAKKPHLFHKQFHEGEITEQREKHFKEHVLDSIPFHQNILDDLKKRLETLHTLIPKRTYLMIHDISRKYGGTPDYFVYDKETKEFFFVAEGLDDARKNWMILVRDVHQICDVMVINKPQ
ncbi:hypothetical protein J4460_05455 [Candidatus Woesearchaeota archaeon]|nr:MAG: hypothetical protein QS99_C0015G0004 [archaeon GW2011_AR4]MBS3130092.1 hypothetical protein [Candidatus Woesearchaeota archaeon]HIH38709.1 hypothetical protein [Candidatus Woesearchaeota archaeon]HIH49309.1 hypothetical protein [Candidatus Woesearchaeota archaeon]HIJ03649.1 hypothetical protein [Candidatus Woesearchaeota archaeon]